MCIFYTDNHYTMRGAFYVYQALLEHLNTEYGEGLRFPEWDECVYHRNDKRSVGTYLRKFGDSGRIDRDYLEYALPADMPDAVRYESGMISETPIITNHPTYAAFVSDSANTVLRTNRPERPNILFVGYSYKNALEVLAVYNFNEVHAIDPRRYSGSISDYILDHDLDYVVIVRDDVYAGHEGIMAQIETIKHADRP